MAVNIAKTFPVPSGPCGQVQYGLLADSDENLYVGKVDYQISDKNSFFSRILIAHLTQANTYNGGDGLTVNSYGLDDTDESIAFGDTYLFTANAGEFAPCGRSGPTS